MSEELEFKLKQLEELNDTIREYVVSGAKYKEYAGFLKVRLELLNSIKRFPHEKLSQVEFNNNTVSRWP